MVKNKAKKWLIYGIHAPDFIECTIYELKEARSIKSSEPPLVQALKTLKNVLRVLEDELYED